MPKLDYQSPPRRLISLLAMKVIIPLQLLTIVSWVIVYVGAPWPDANLVGSATVLSILLLVPLAVISVLMLVADYFWERRAPLLLLYLTVEAIVLAAFIVFLYFLGRAAIGAR